LRRRFLMLLAVSVIKILPIVVALVLYFFYALGKLTA